MAPLKPLLTRTGWATERRDTACGTEQHARTRNEDMKLFPWGVYRGVLGNSYIPRVVSAATKTDVYVESGQTKRCVNRISRVQEE